MKNELSLNKWQTWPLDDSLWSSKASGVVILAGQYCSPQEICTVPIKPLSEEKAEEMAEILTTGKWIHDYPLTCKQLSEMGFTVSNEMLREMYILMELYPQPPQRRPSVQYVPYDDGAGKR